MFRKLSNSWQLVKASWAVLKTNRTMLLFPLFSGLTMIAVMLVFFVPFATVAGIFSIFTGDGTFNEILGFIVLFVFYLISYTVVIFFNTALIGSALIYMDGGTPTTRDGLKLARERLRNIVMYAAISATIGVVLQFVRERLGFLGELISWLGGMAWGLATYLVIPVMVSQDISPIDAIKQSAALLRKTWGEQIAGEFGIGTVFGLLIFATIFIGGFLIAVIASALDSAGVVIFGAVVLILTLIGLGIVSSALSGIYQAALYRYAESGVVPDEFDIRLISGAFTEKKKK